MKVARSLTGIAAAAAVALMLLSPAVTASTDTPVAAADEKAQVALFHVEDMT